MARAATIAPENRIDLETAAAGVQAYLHRRSDSKGGTWHFRANFPNETVRKSTGTADTKVAKSVGRQMLADAKERVKAGKKAKPTTFAEAAEAYVRDNIGNPDSWGKLSDSERKSRRDTLRMLNDHLLPYFAEKAPNVAIDALTESHVDGYKAWRNARRAGLIAGQDAALAERRDAAKAKWEASPRLQKLHPDLAAYLPSRRIGNTQETVSASALNQENAVVHHVLAYAASGLGAAAKKSLPRMKRMPTGKHVPRKGFTDREFALIRKEAEKRSREARRDAVKDLVIRRIKDRGGHQSSYRPLMQTRVSNKDALDAWTGHPTAWARWNLVQIIDLLEGTGMRPSTLAKMRRYHVGLREGTVEPEPKDDDLSWLYCESDAKVSTEPEPGEDPEHLPEGERRSPPPDYLLTGRTRKGCRPDDPDRVWEIVPERGASEALRNLIERMPDDPQAPLIAVTPSAINKAFKKVLRDCGLEYAADGTPHSLYDLRHRYISKKLKAKVSIESVAANTMTSPAMIHLHYRHIKPSEEYEELSRPVGSV